MRTLFKLFFSGLWNEVFRPLFILLVSKAGKDLWDTCVTAVKGVEHDFPDLEGVEKFKITFGRVTETLEAKGKEYPTWLKNIFIELAVGFVKKYFGIEL